MKRVVLVALLVLLASPPFRQVRAQQSRRFVPVTEAMLQNRMQRTG